MKVFTGFVKCSDFLQRNPSTSTGLKVFSTIKDKVYAKARKVSETFKKNMKIVFDDYLGEWDYKPAPKVKTESYFLAIP